MATTPATAIVIRTDGTIYDIELPTGDSSAVIRQHLECTRFDVVALTNRLDMWIDDEGYDVLPLNPVATALARHFGFVWQNYHGPVLLCGVDADGASTNLALDQTHALLRPCQRLRA